LSIEPGTYIVDNQKNLDPDHDINAYLARGKPKFNAFTVTPGSRLFLGTYYADGTVSFLIPRNETSLDTRKFTDILHDNLFRPVLTFEPSQALDFTQPTCATF
jgi:hypothetical protein